MIIKIDPKDITNYLDYNNSSYKNFLNWSKEVTILSKEKGKINFDHKHWYSGQKILFQTLFKTLESKDIRTVVVLKARQLGITTSLSLFDLYYAMSFKNTKAAIVAHDEATIKEVRAIITKYYWKSLQPNKKRPMVRNNAEHTTFTWTDAGTYDSDIAYYHPKTRNKATGNMGRGQATTFAHLTEVAYYPSVDDINNFEATFSETNPKRLFVYESTANGFNFYYDTWEAAKESNTMAALFIGWWLKDEYQVNNEADLLKYGYDLTPDEKERVDEVKRVYNYEISMEQLAWWRKTLREKIKDSYETSKTKLDQMYEMYPFIPEDAFRASGSNYFVPTTLRNAQEEIKEPLKRFEPIFFDKPSKTQLAPSQTGHLKIWEDPIDLKYNGYILSFDPAYSTNPESDRAVIQVWKAFRDKIFQVAEWASPTSDTIQSCYLFLKIGAMFNAYLSMYEIDGAGRAVAQIIQLLRRTIIEENIQDKTLYEYARKMKDYVYRRVDSMTPGSAIQWITGGNKHKIMAQLKATVADGSCIIRSSELMQELKYIVIDSGDIGAIKSKHDDRVMAAAFAVEAWEAILQPMLPFYEEYLKKETKQQEIDKLRRDNPQQLLISSVIKQEFANAGYKIKDAE